MILYLNKDKLFNKKVVIKESSLSLLVESKNSERAHRQTREVIANIMNNFTQSTDYTSGSEDVIKIEQEFEAMFFGEGLRVDWLITLEPNAYMWAYNNREPEEEIALGYLRYCKSRGDILFPEVKIDMEFCEQNGIRYEKGFKTSLTPEQRTELESIKQPYRDQRNAFIAQVRQINDIEQLKTYLDPMIQQDKAEMMEKQKGMEVNLNQNYQVLGPLSFNEAQKYGNFSGYGGGNIPNSRICYTQGEGTWNGPDYSNKGQNNCYLLLRNDWEKYNNNEELAIHDGSEANNGLEGLQYDGYDDYGLSMIFVWITPEGELHESNTRWNHEARYAPGHRVDLALNEVDIANIMGAPFGKVFNVSRFEDKVAEIEQRLANGEDPNNVFETIGDQFGNYRFVGIYNKWNLVDEETKRNILLPVWFDEAIKSGDGYMVVSNKKKEINIISENLGKYLLNEWVYSFHDEGNGYIRVEKVITSRKNYNYVNVQTGEFTLNESTDIWFSEVRDYNSLIQVCIKINEITKYNVIDKENNYQLVYKHPINEWFNKVIVYDGKIRVLYLNDGTPYPYYLVEKKMFVNFNYIVDNILKAVRKDPSRIKDFFNVRYTYDKLNGYTLLEVEILDKKNYINMEDMTPVFYEWFKQMSAPSINLLCKLSNNDNWYSSPTHIGSIVTRKIYTKEEYDTIVNNLLNGGTDFTLFAPSIKEGNEGEKLVFIEGKGCNYIIDGKLMCDRFYSNCNPFINGLGLVRFNDGENGLVNREGKIVSRSKYISQVKNYDGEKINLYTGGYLFDDGKLWWHFIKPNGVKIDANFTDYAIIGHYAFIECDESSEEYYGEDARTYYNIIDLESGEKLFPEGLAMDVTSENAVEKVGGYQLFDKEGGLLAMLTLDGEVKTFDDFVNNAFDRIEQGEDPSHVFDEIREFSDGKYIVSLEGRSNIIDSNMNLLLPHWVSFINDLKDGWAFFYDEQFEGRKCNYLNADLELYDKEGFDDAWNFVDGKAKASIGGGIYGYNSEKFILYPDGTREKVSRF